MTRSRNRKSSASSSAPRWPWIGLGLTFLSPLVVFVALVGLKTGAWPIGTAYDVLTWQVAAGLAVVGIGGASIAVLAGVFSFQRSWAPMLIAVLVSLATVFLFFREYEARTNDRSRGVGVSTNAADPVGFPAALIDARDAAGADALAATSGPDGCPIQSLPTQVAPGVAAYGLQKAGFTVGGVGVGRGDGTYTSVWFDRTYDAVIRIRPGQTDVRVAPRDGARDHGTSCRLAISILKNLQ